MKRLLLLITICISSVSFGQTVNDIEIISKGWAPYTKIPLKHRDTLDLYIFIRNNGQTVQSNIVGSVTIDGTIFNTSNPMSLAGGEVDTILLGQFIPSNSYAIHEFIFNISSDNDVSVHWKTRHKQKNNKFDKRNPKNLLNRVGNNFKTNKI